jgi:hypothetical protein
MAHDPARPANPVDPDQLVAAFIITSESRPAEEEEARFTEAEAGDICKEIMRQLGADRRTTSDLFRRCVAMANFFPDVEHRRIFSVDDSTPDAGIWRAAATAPVHQTIVGGLERHTFDLAEFAEAVRGQGS